MFENKKQALISHRAFLKRLIKSFIYGYLIIFISLLVGIFGYHHLNHLSWIDSFVEASMILGGMGPSQPLTTFSSKVFAGCYALYCGLMLILTVGIVFAPIIHRFFHAFHVDTSDKK